MTELYRPYCMACLQPPDQISGLRRLFLFWLCHTDSSDFLFFLLLLCGRLVSLRQKGMGHRVLILIPEFRLYPVPVQAAGLIRMPEKTVCHEADGFLLVISCSFCLSDCKMKETEISADRSERGGFYNGKIFWNRWCPGTGQ